MIRRASASLLLGALVALLLASAGPVQARKPSAPCHAAGTTVAKHGGQSLIVVAVGEGDDLYSPPQDVLACRSARAKPVRISEWGPSTSIAIRKVRWTRNYVSYSQFGSDNQCSKYSGTGASECSYSEGGSYDLRTGRRRTSYDPTGVASTRLSPHGWVAVIGTPDATGRRTIFGADGRGQRALATGAIDPASVRFVGTDLLWTLDGVEQRATLGPASR